MLGFVIFHTVVVPAVSTAVILNPVASYVIGATLLRIAESTYPDRGVINYVRR